MSATLLKQEKIGTGRSLIIAYAESDLFKIFMCVKSLPTTAARWSVLRHNGEKGYNSFAEIETDAVPSAVKEFVK